MISIQSWPLALAITFLGSLAFITIHSLRNKLQTHLKDIPGPPLAAYTRLWRTWDVARGQTHVHNLQWHRKYGPLVRIGPNVISVGDPAMLPVIYNAKGDFPKTAFYPIQSVVYKGVPQRNIFSERVEAMHRVHKRKLAHEYSLDFLLRMEDQVDDCSRVFVKKLSEFADRGEPVDLGSFLQYYAFDVIGEITFTQKFGFMEKAGDVDGIIATISFLLYYSAVVGQIPELHTFLLGNPLIPKVFPSMDDWNAVARFTLRQINQRTRLDEGGELQMNEGMATKDMFSSWAGKKSEDKIDTRDVVVFTGGNVFAGSDTTAIALRSILYHLLKTPAALQKLVQELDDADRAGRLSSPVAHKEALALPYLNAAIKEGMRMHPSVGLILERTVPDGGATLCGRHIPGGTIVGINSWVLHYDPNVFPHPEEFQPERWLETGADGDSERLAAMERSFCPFGAGSRTCVGRNISMLEMRKIIPELLRRFEFTIPNGEEWKVFNMWFVQQEMPKCFVKRRAQKA